MMHRVMTTFQRYKKYILYVLPILLLIVFISSIIDRNFYIGGDLILPIKPSDNINKFIYVWEEQSGGVSFFKYVYILWQGVFYILHTFSIPSDVGIKIFILLGYILGFIFSILCFRAIFIHTKYYTNELAVVTGLLFLLSPASILLMVGTLYLFAIPVCAYFFLRYVESRNLLYTIPFAVAFNIAYLADFPQIKHLVVFLLCLFFLVLLFREMKKVLWINIVSSSVIFFVAVALLNAFVLLPALHDAFGSYGIYTSYVGNVDIRSGTADLHSASLPYITRFFNSNLINNTSKIGVFLSSTTFVIWSFLMWILIISSYFFIKNRKDKTLYFILLSGIIFFIFLAKGPNPPFGELYQYLLLHFPSFKIFRTTSTLIIGGVIFYTYLITLAIYRMSKRSKFVLPVVLVIHVLVFHPIYLGYKLINYYRTDTDQRGINIPKEYFEIGEVLNQIREDQKILSVPIDEGYTYKDWNYAGASLINWVTYKPVIHDENGGANRDKFNLELLRKSDKQFCIWAGIHNIGFLLKEKDSRGTFYPDDFDYQLRTHFENNLFELQGIGPNCRYPHIYSPKNVIRYDNPQKVVPLINFLESPIAFTNQDLGNITMSEGVTDNFFDLAGKNYMNLVYPIDITAIRYTASIPYDGQYEFWTENSNEVNKVLLGDSELRPKSKYNLTAGIKEIEVKREKKNLLEGNWKNPKQGEITSQGIHYQEVKAWDISSLYYVRLKYKATQGKVIRISMVEQSDIYEGRRPPQALNNTLFDEQVETHRDGEGEFNAIVRSDIYARAAQVYVYNYDENTLNLQAEVIKLVTPRIFFVNHSNKQVQVPNLSFKKINPTKYVVNVTGVNEPYYLVLSETFNPGWRAYIDLQNNQFDERFQGKVFVRYFDNKVQELSSCNKFIDRHISETWNKKPITESRHFRANTFANGWSILPSDAAGLSEYTIVLEYYPQRFLLIGLLISGATVVFCILHQCILTRKR